MSTTNRSTGRRTLLSRVVDIRPDERKTVVLMFSYAFAVMTAYNIVQPVTRSAFIDDLGAENLPYLLLATGALIGLVMQLYGSVMTRLPRRWALPIAQLGMTAVLMLFFLLFQRETRWVSSGFYFFGQVLGTLLLSQFWTLANDVYDPRQARRLFGLIGGGASLGGMAGSGLAALSAGQIGTPGLLLASSAALVAAVGIRRRHRRSFRQGGSRYSVADLDPGLWSGVATAQHRQHHNGRGLGLYRDQGEGGVSRIVPKVDRATRVYS